MLYQCYSLSKTKKSNVNFSATSHLHLTGKSVKWSNTLKNRLTILNMTVNIYKYHDMKSLCRLVRKKSSPGSPP